ncbi:MAG: dihydrolipoamide acetyltransferase family protein, partial [Chthoniobacterales bacterium]
MPSLGADMEAAILRRWRVKSGDEVKRGDIIADVETDKGLIEVEVFENGIVDQILGEVGKKLPVGTLLATIRGEGEPAKPISKVPPPPVSIAHVRASPLARKRAAELGIDLAQIKGSGPGGVIEEADVVRASGTPKEEERTPEEKLRRAIAAAMSRANREIPHYYLETQIEMSRSLGWLNAHNAERPIKERILPAALLVKAVARALRDVPELNGYWINDALQKQESAHIGFAIAMRQSGGLIAPAIHNVRAKSVDEVMAAMHDLIPRARSGHLRSSELTDATITVTNLGDLAVRTVFGVIYPPQVALVGFGNITDQPWVENGQLLVRPV